MEWTPPSGTLGEILDETRERVASIERDLAGRRSQPRDREGGLHPRGLREALSGRHVAVVGEIKRRSPSRGDLNTALGAADQARRFERAGASAISVLTEPRRFGGTTADLRAAADATRIPLLRKDFHISPFQLQEAVENGASAVLLIARALSPSDLAAMLLAAGALRLESVVEVRTDEELELALRLNARIIGVNSRDLETLEVDESVPERLIPKIPASVIAIWESGVGTAADVQRAAASGADAVLVGSALSLAPDPEALLGTLTDVPRRPRG
ncbi:MAG TPA: indole-3-glycerol phosphate synthase TrpC [Gemmatimonadaceae bacterium]|nr:indole-3-glycerol phosphate synthase TrpC [Gemmatimonadaceae bacterium]